MTHPTPHVEHGVLTLESEASAIAVGTPAWFRWLEQATAFSFASPQGGFTARRERTSSGRGDWYWRAYLYRGGARRGAYLGRAAELSLERLQTVATQLAGSETPIPAIVPAPAASAPAPAPSLLTTKLYRPRTRPDLVARPRLLARLDAGLHGTLTLVCAPAGFGKTTLLADWLGRANRPVAWLGLDASDSDPAAFLRYLVAALQTLAPGVGATLTGLLEAPQLPALEALLTTLLNDMTALPPESLLVLDDYHVLTAPPIHQAVGFLIDHLPPTLHLVIATREDPPLPLARLRARRQVSELRAEQLRFTADEAAAFLTEVMALPLTADDVAALGARTEGWIAGLQLAALAMQDRDEHAGFIAAFTGSNRFIGDYLADEVLGRQPAHIQRFLLQTAILDRMCGPLCDVVRGGVEPVDSPQIASQSLLEQLERANLFVIPLDAERQWYRYHHLFGEMLRARLRRGMPAADVAALHRRAGTWYAQADYTSEAVQHALAGQDYERAALLVERLALAMIQRTELAQLLAWLDRLPHEVVQARPLLGLSYAWGLFLSGRIGAAVGRLEAVEAGLAAGRTLPSPEVQGHIAAMRAYLVRETGDLDATIAYSQQALAHLAEGETLLRAMVVVNLAIAHYLNGAFDEAAKLLNETVAAGQTAQLMANTLSAIYILTQLHRASGDLRQALKLCQEGLALVDRHGWQRSPAVGFVHVAIGELLRERNQLDAAAEHLAQGVALGWEGGHPHILIAGHVWLAWLRQIEGDVAGSQEAIDAALQVVQTHQVSRYWPLPVAACDQVRLWIARGELAAANVWGQAHERGWHGASGAYVDEAEEVTLARLWIARGENAAAAALLRQLQQAAVVGGRRGSLIEILILLAITSAAQQRDEEALEALSQALGLAEPESYVRIFVDEGAPVKQLLEAQRVTFRARGDPLEHYCERLLAAFEQPATIQRDDAPLDVRFNAPTLQRLVEPLTARELEVLRLVAEGASNGEIARRLIVSIGTVKKHTANIFGKLAVQSRTQAVARARALGLL